MVDGSIDLLDGAMDSGGDREKRMDSLVVDEGAGSYPWITEGGP